ncbi:MAG: aldehyde dehydrogenase family protein [bacterium]|jgi:glyceraldehyde-3-phosphate dehydrogenase (NADP+)
MATEQSFNIPDYPNIIAGEESAEGGRVIIRNPYDLSPLGAVFDATPAEAERAIAAAHRAFEKTRRIPAHERKAILTRLRDLVLWHAPKFAELLCRENAKPIALCRAELARVADTLTLSAEEAGRLTGEFLPFDSAPGGEGRFGIARRFPLGPVAAITPFNFPLNLLAHKIGPALAVGAPVVHKPCVQAPLTAFEFARLVYESGWPQDAYSVIYAQPDAAQLLVTDGRIKVLSFTGSDAVGWKLKSLAGKKRVLLELGGSASCIIEPDMPDRDTALSRCVNGAFAYSGQVCISIQRLMVSDEIYDTFVPQFVERAKKLTLGDPMSQDTSIGPVIDDSAAERIEKWVREAEAAGARILTGKYLGNRMFEPYILENVPATCELGCNEIFGPVVALYRYGTLDEAIALTNASRYGLQSGLFTSNISKAFRAFEQLEVGGLMINEVPGWRTDGMPYGGTKDSGVGREGPRYAIEDYTEIRLLAIKQ